MAEDARAAKSDLRKAAWSIPKSPVRHQRRRRAHQRVDSYDEVAASSPAQSQPELVSSPSKARSKHSEQIRRGYDTPESHYYDAPAWRLSAGQLAELDRLNRKHGWSQYDESSRSGIEDAETSTEYFDDESEWDRRELAVERERSRLAYEDRERRSREDAERVASSRNVGQLIGVDAEQRIPRSNGFQKHDTRSRSEQALTSVPVYHKEKDAWREETREDHSPVDSKFDEHERRRKRKRRRNICIGVVVFLVLLAIVIPVAVVMTRKKGGLNGISHSSIPEWARGTYLDPFDWYDTQDFNVTFTNTKVGGLYVMGLNSTWDDSTRAYDNVPPLNEQWNYGSMPFRGVNLGGWLSIEPFITPSLFSSYDNGEGVVDEWSLCEYLGPEEAKSTLEKHYSEWVQESTFAEIQAAGFDHIRIPFSYWAVTTYDGDPYVPMVSWRYLLRGIEWARKYGLRINLDLHAVPGSQNGWSHSGHQGTIGWLNGTNGDLNGQRSIDIHEQLSTFFNQPRYENIITMYGLVNEPKMSEIPEDTVLDWSKNAITTIRGNGYTGLIVVADGFLGLDNWQGKLEGFDNLVLDGHQYTIFDTALLSLTHYDKIDFACGGWTGLAQQSLDPATGFGPTMFGEWSQADSDCVAYLNNVGVGTRWEGTLDTADTPGGASTGSVLTPSCPADDKSLCSCTQANADPSSYSDIYKTWLLTFAQAQMDSFEVGWGCFYWTWKTENATQWSYKDGMAAGILPQVAYHRSWDCDMDIPDFSGLPEYY